MNPLEKRKCIAAETVGEIDWIDETTGYCTCPGNHLHTTKAGRKDCRVSVDGAPTIYCVHESCTEIVAEKNRELRSKIGASEPDWNQHQAPSDWEQRLQKRRLLKQAHALRHTILSPTSEYAWPFRQLAGSRFSSSLSPGEQALLIFSLFAPDDIVWSGNVVDSGRPKHQRCFKPASEWKQQAFSVLRLEETNPRYGPFVVPSSFKADSFQRSKDNVLHPRFLVVESDTLTHDEFGGVIRWLKDGIEMHLYAVISTGGKSLHAWFEYPPPEILAELRVILPGLGCDEKMFNPAQPCRLPGVIRKETGRMQEMIYFNRGNR